LIGPQFRTAQLYLLGMVVVGLVYYGFMRIADPETLQHTQSTDPEAAERQRDEE
jgi:hypothetical protein